MVVLATGNKMRSRPRSTPNGLLVSVPAYSRFPDGLVGVPARKQIVYCLILPGEREPRGGHREMKFAVIRLACFLSRQQTLCRVIAVASRIVHGALHSPPTCFGVESRWLDLGRMRPLADGVCIKLLTRHPPPSQVAHYHPGSSCEANGGF